MRSPARILASAALCASLLSCAPSRSAEVPTTPTESPRARGTASTGSTGRPPKASAFSTAPTAARITLIHLSDTEAGITADGEGAGGVARARAIIDALRTRAAHPLVVHAGDSLIPSPELSLELDGTSAVVGANELLGVAAWGLGNHELDLGEAFFSDVVKRTSAPIITCTLDIQGGPLAELTVKDLRTTPWLHEVRGRIVPRARACTGSIEDGACTGFVVGLIGATTEQLRAISTGASQNLVLPPSRAAVVERIQEQVRALEAEGITTIVLLSHLQGIEHDLDLLKRGLTGVDVIVSAGGENRLATPRQRLLSGDEPDRLCRRTDDACYPLARTAADGAAVLLVATSGGMRYVGHLVFDVDDAGRLTGVAEASRPVPIDDTALLEVSTSIDRATLAFEQRVQRELQPLLQVVGHTGVYLEGARERVRNRETNLGDASADAIFDAARAFAPDAQPTFALRNAGALRASIGTVDARTSERRGGDIRLLDVKSALRFDSKIVVVTVTHAALRETLEAALVGAGTSRGHFPQVSRGVQLTYATKPAEQVARIQDGRVVGVQCVGRRVQELTIPGTAGPVVVVKDGETVQPRAQVTFATVDYLASGGDGWFPGGKPEAVPVVGPDGVAKTDQSAFLAYLRSPAWQDGAPYAEPPGGEPVRIRQVLVLEDDAAGDTRCVPPAR